jgi:serine/threonine protein kinase/tetratricopeptide (TPR) repeat protein
VAQEYIGGKTLLKGTCLVCNEEFFGLSVCPNDGTAISMVQEDPLVGNILAERFEVLAKLGEGGMSAVYKARHMLMDRIVAIKLLFASDIASLKRFQLEAKLACNLNHINIVSVFDFGVSTQGQPYLVMDYLEGRSLGDCIKIDGPLQLDRALGIFTQACDALTYAHKRDVVHRDLKPSNFMLVLDDNYSELLKVVDFGIAKQINFEEPSGQGLTKTGEVFGSPLYMAPEQCLGRKLDARADIYSMGCVMYEALTGTPPLVGVNALDTLHKHISEDPLPFAITNPACRNLPEPLEKLVFKALARDVDQRYQSMLELWTDLEVLLHAAKGGGGKVPSVSPKVTASPPAMNSLQANTIPVVKPGLSPSDSLSSSNDSKTMPPGLTTGKVIAPHAVPPYFGQDSTRGPGTASGTFPARPSGGVGQSNNRMNSMASPANRLTPMPDGSTETASNKLSARMPAVQNPQGSYNRLPANSPGENLNLEQGFTESIPKSRSLLSNNGGGGPTAIGGPDGKTSTSKSALAAEDASQNKEEIAALAQKRVGSTSRIGPGLTPADVNSSQTGIAANKGRPRVGDVSRTGMTGMSIVTAQIGKSSQLMLPLSIVAAVLLGSGCWFFYANNSAQKQDVSNGTAPGVSTTGGIANGASHVAIVGAAKSGAERNADAIPPASSSADWRELQKQGLTALGQCNYKVAYERLRDAMTKSSGHPLDDEYGQLLAQFGQAASKTDHFQDAIDNLTRAQSIFGRSHTPESELLAADCKNYLGLVYTNQMDYNNAKAFLDEAKKIRDQYGKAEDKADSDLAMAKLYNRFESRDGSFGTDNAIKMLQDSLVGKSNDAAFVIESKNDLGFSYNRKHEYKQARYFYEQALASARQNFGVDHPLYADSLVGLGTLNSLENNDDLATKQFLQALPIREKNYGEKSIKTSEVFACLGYANVKKNPDKAKEYFENALAIKRDLLGADNREYIANETAYHRVLKHKHH